MAMKKQIQEAEEMTREEVKQKEKEQERERMKEKLWELFKVTVEKLLVAVKDPEVKPYYLDVAVKFLKMNRIYIDPDESDHDEMDEVRGELSNLYDLPFEESGPLKVERATSKTDPEKPKIIPIYHKPLANKLKT